MPECHREPLSTNSNNLSTVRPIADEHGQCHIAAQNEAIPGGPGRRRRQCKGTHQMDTQTILDGRDEMATLHGASATEPAIRGPEPDYILGRSDSETARLILQDQIYRPITRGLLESAGIGPGMSVLDIGSGAGDVSLLIAELVGPKGRVVGVDMDAAI